MTSLSEKAAALYKGEALAPMVRASTTPLRALALQYGADFVYTEELVDRSLFDTQRIVNEELQTIDYIKDTTKLSKKVQKRLANDGNRPALMLRIDPKLEGSKLVCQIGSGEPELALPAALHVQQDVAAFDINMGCPKKFSVSGGMGSALLSDPERASRIIRTLRDHLPHHPVSCKIRLLKDTQSTVDFVTAMVNAGVHAVAIHARRPGDDCVEPAKWSDLEEVLPLVRAKFPTLPLLINGDFYTRKEFTEFHNQYGTSGVLLGRPALYNTSIFRKPPPPPPSPSPPADDETTVVVDPDNSISYHYGYDSPLLLDKTLVVQDYLRQGLRYHTHHKNIKYVIAEMMGNRRTPTWRVPSMPQKFPGNQTIGKTSSCNSLEALCKLWDVKFSLYSASKEEEEALPAGEHKYEDSYLLRGEQSTTTAAASNEKTEQPTEKVTSPSNCGDEKKEDEPPNKRARIEQD